MKVNESRLFEPIAIGTMHLNHRIAMAPMSRYRADNNHTPTPAMVDYYSQRACVPGTLIITEASFISPSQVGFANRPSIYNKAQVGAWQKVTKAVHAHGSFIVCQLLAVGRAIDQVVASRKEIEVMSSSPTRQHAEHAISRAMTVEDIQQTVRDFATAAENAIRAGFDAVEVQGAYGYLIN
jgi:NADPH2 dehydrogenase